MKFNQNERILFVLSRFIFEIEFHYTNSLFHLLDFIDSYFNRIQDLYFQFMLNLPLCYQLFHISSKLKCTHFAVDTQTVSVRLKNEYSYRNSIEFQTI